MSAAALVPIVAGVVVLHVAICAGGDVVVGQVLLLLQLVGVFHLLELISLMGALMSVPGQLLVVSFEGVLAAVLWFGK